MTELRSPKARDPENRSRKGCACGGHNTSNSKANRRHNGTAARLEIRKARKRRAAEKQEGS